MAVLRVSKRGMVGLEFGRAAMLLRWVLVSALMKSNVHMGLACFPKDGEC